MAPRALWRRGGEPQRYRAQSDRGRAGTIHQLTRRVRPKRGDILYTAVGATYGVALHVDFDDPFVFQRHIAHIISNVDILDSEYLVLFLNSPHGKR